MAGGRWTELGRWLRVHDRLAVVLLCAAIIVIFGPSACGGIPVFPKNEPVEVGDVVVRPPMSVSAHLTWWPPCPVSRSLSIPVIFNGQIKEVSISEGGDFGKSTVRISGRYWTHSDPPSRYVSHLFCSDEDNVSYYGTHLGGYCTLFEAISPRAHFDVGFYEREISPSNWLDYRKAINGALHRFLVEPKPFLCRLGE